MYKNKSKILHSYKRSEQSHSLAKSSKEIVQILLVELERSMNIVADKLENKGNEQAKNDIEIKNRHFSKAMTAIYTLQVSLNFDAGQDIAIKLFQLYEYCRKNLIKGFVRQAVLDIRKAATAIADILAAWNIYLERK